MSSSPSRQPFRTLDVAVIGGGIGGLAAAAALRRAGCRATVYERAAEIGELFAGLAVWANALRVLDGLGAGDRLRAVGQPVTACVILSPEGRALRRTDLAGLPREIGAPGFIMLRADLQQALRAVLPAAAVVTRAECRGYRSLGNGRMEVHFLGRDPVEADLVIGADGFNSVIRTQLCGPTPVRYLGQTCFRGVAMAPVAEPGLLAEIQGPGRRLGLCPLGPQALHWWACLNAPVGERLPPARARAQLAAAAAGWPLQLADYIARTPASSVLQHDLCDRPPLPAWSRGQVTLLGDAAHPMLPDLGPGAGTAIEDAAVLARCLQEERSITSALSRYEAERIPRTTRLAERAWNAGRLARWSRPGAVKLRELGLRLTPAGVLRRELHWLLAYHAGFPARVP